MDVLLILLFLGLFIATYRDIQIREVPDTVSYGLIVIGLLGGLLLALIHKDVWIFVEHLSGFVAGLLLGLLMFYGRQWGGGDAKLIMGVGAILGLSFENYSFLEFVLLLIVLGAVYGLLYTIVLGIVHRKKFLKEWKLHIRTSRVHKIRIALVATGILLVILVFFVSTPGKIILGFLLVGLYALTYFWIVTKVVEKSIMTKTYATSKLTEGDWLAQDVKKGKKVLVEGGGTGLTLKDIKKIKKAKIKKVLVREGIPFVPSFLLAFLVMLALHWFLGKDFLLGWLF